MLFGWTGFELSVRVGQFPFSLPAAASARLRSLMPAIFEARHPAGGIFRGETRQ